MKCPHCGKKINPAALLGAQGKGKPKNFSKAETKRRSDRMKALNAKRRSERGNDQVELPPNGGSESKKGVVGG